MESEYATFFYDSSKTDKCEEVIDYFISWTLRCAETIYKNKQKNKVHLYSKRILSKLLFGDIYYLEDQEVKSVKTWKQYDRIDVWVEVEIQNDPNKYALIIENKLYALLERHQLPDYKEKALKYYSDKDFKIKFIFLRCADEFQEIDQLFCLQNDFEAHLLSEIKKEAITDGLTGNDLFDEFWFYWWRY
ncbi:PD-(D/E)XK nuclease family protein [Dysgonomonas capnocytophagoides]|uniref:PD-(D/E)XK nuclease family protein n=1 Tax=Dysgonomonas capnocytophagoides TaxID=45254 RepID=UPI0039932F90